MDITCFFSCMWQICILQSESTKAWCDRLWVEAGWVHFYRSCHHMRMNKRQSGNECVQTKRQREDTVEMLPPDQPVVKIVWWLLWFSWFYSNGNNIISSAPSLRICTFLGPSSSKGWWGWRIGHRGCPLAWGQVHAWAGLSTDSLKDPSVTGIAQRELCEFTQALPAFRQNRSEDKVLLMDLRSFYVFVWAVQPHRKRHMTTRCTFWTTALRSILSIFIFQLSQKFTKLVKLSLCKCLNKVEKFLVKHPKTLKWLCAKLKLWHQSSSGLRQR